MAVNGITTTHLLHLILSVYSVSALECIKCNHFDWEGPLPSDLPEEFKAKIELTRNNNPSCREISPSADLSSMRETCGSGTMTLPVKDGMTLVWGCGKVDGGYSKEGSGE